MQLVKELSLERKLVKTFKCTGTIQEFIVPENVKFINISAKGAGGGSGNMGLVPGGYGAEIRAYFAVKSKQKIFVLVGESGAEGTIGIAGGGGGGTFVWLENNEEPMLVAGGGGGGSLKRGKHAVLHPKNFTTNTCETRGGFGGSFSSYDAHDLVSSGKPALSGGFNGLAKGEAGNGGFGCGGGGAELAIGVGAGGGGGGYIGGVGGMAQEGGLGGSSVVIGGIVKEKKLANNCGDDGIVSISWEAPKIPKEMLLRALRKN